METEIEEFLRESNAIEGIYDDDSLQQAKYAWEFLEKKDKLTTGIVLRAHKILMLHQSILPNQKGYVRYCNVKVGNHVAPYWHEVNKLLADWVNTANKLIDPIFDHVNFEFIHPFVDGNGRVGRMLMNWQRVKNGDEIMVIKESERQEYYRWFR